MRLGRTTLFHFSTQVIVSIAGFASTFAIGFFLGAPVLGQYSIAVALGFYWLVIPGNAIATAITKRVSEGVEPGAFLSAGFAVNGVVALLSGLGILIAGSVVGVLVPEPRAPFIRILVGSKELLAGLAVAAIFFRTSVGGLQGQKKVSEAGGIGALERVLRTSGQIAFILAGFTLAGLVVGHVVSLLVAGLVALVLYDLVVVRPSRSHVRSILEFGQFGWATTLQGRVFGWLDVLVLAFFVSDGQIGIYEAAWGFGSLLATLSTSVQATLFPEISELAVEEEFDLIRHYLGEGIVFAGIFVIPGLFGAVVIGERLLEIYRPSFGQGATILVVLILAYVGDVYGSQFVSALNAIDRPDVTYRVNLLFIGTNVVLNVALIWSFGWYGAAAATALSAWLRALLAYGSLAEYLGHPEVPLPAMGAQVVAAAAMAVVVTAVNRGVPGTRAYTVLLVLLGAAVYVSILVALSSFVRRKVVGLVRSTGAVAR